MHASFFEDHAFFSFLTDRLLPHLWQQKQETSPKVRIWSIGCQAGDEALLLLLSLLRHQQVPASTSPFTIFATDPDKEAVIRARRLAASSQLETWPAVATFRSLLKEGRSLPEAWRQSLIFATHNLLTDVPFPHLDFIISHLSLPSYTEPQQAEIFNRLAYALVPQGFLLLLGDQPAIIPDAVLYQRDDACLVPCYQRTATPVKQAALGLAHQRSYQPPATTREDYSNQDRDAVVEELQVLLEEQTVLSQELEAQARQNQEARLAQLQLVAIVDSSEDAILSKDLDGIVTSWNTGAERLYGYSAQEMVGQSVARIFPPDRQEELTRIMEQIRWGERVGNYETLRMRKNGMVIPVSVTVSPVKESNGTIVGASAIAHDITARCELEQQRAAFIDLITHELKNPLTALSGNLQLAQRLLTRLLARQDHLNDEDQRILEDVLTMLGRSQQQMRTQKRLIDDLLDLSHVQQGTLELHQELCNLLTVVYDTIQNYQAAYPSRLIDLNLPEQEEVLVYADRDRLEQVLSNYLSNALKFSPAERAIRVGMRLQEESVGVWVQDEGPGLSPGQQAHIWERYFQVSQTPVQTGWKVGLGLGLYICRQIMLQQQGDVSVESVPGQGATFWFRLPIFRQG